MKEGGSNHSKMLECEEVTEDEDNEGASHNCNQSRHRTQLHYLTVQPACPGKLGTLNEHIFDSFISILLRVNDRGKLSPN